jgi:hypothetical protein
MRIRRLTGSPQFALASSPPWPLAGFERVDGLHATA